MNYMSSGNDYRILNITLTDTYQDIEIPRAITSMAIKVRGGVAVKWRRSSDLTNEWTFSEGEQFSIDGSMGVKVGETIVIGQAKVDAGTAVLEIMYWYK